MASKILRGGRFVSDEGYERGPMILYTKEEWKGNHRCVSRGRVVV